MSYRLSPDDEELIRRTLQAESAKRATLQASATPELSARVGQIHTLYPGLPAGAKLAMAKAGMSDETIAKIYPAASRAMVQQSVQPKKQKSWFQRNVADKVKTGARYGFAALNFPLDMVQGGFAQIFDPNDSIDGWFISTDLGSLIANDEEAGSGYFIGGRAKELQAERARRYRGTVGGHAWTIGRGLASVVSKPDSTAFNIMSGMFDAAAAVMVPTVPGAGQAKQAITGAAAAGRGGAVVSRAADVIEAVGRGSETILPSRLTAQEISFIRSGADIPTLSTQRFVDIGQAQRAAGITKENIPEALDAVVSYTNGTGFFRSLNSFLRFGVDDGTTGIQKNISILDRLFSSAPELDQPTVLWRGLRKETGTGSAEINSFVDSVKNLKPGETFTDKAFVSTTTNKSFATRLAENNDGVVLEIVAPSGTRVFNDVAFRTDDVSRFTGGEAEIMLNRGQKFTVLSNDGKTVRVAVGDLDSMDLNQLKNSVLVGNQVDYKAANRWFGTGQARRIIDRTAETNSFMNVWDLWGRRIDPELALTLAREQDPIAIKNILLDKLGQSEGLANSRNFKGGDRAYLSLSRRDKILNKIPFDGGTRLSRAYAVMPKRNFNLFQAEDPREQAETLRTVENMLKVALVDRDTTRTLMNRAGELITTKNRPAIENFIDDFDNVVRRAATLAKSKGIEEVKIGKVKNTADQVVRTPKVGQYVVGPGGKGYIKSLKQNKNGKVLAVEIDYVDESVDRRIVDAIFNQHKKVRDDQQRFNVDDAGSPTDDGLYKTMFGGVDPDAGDTVFIGPQLASEFMRHEYFFPDVRQIRRLTASKPFATVFVKGADAADPNLERLAAAGQLRMPFAAVEYVQEQIWRPMITATIGNAVRNILDSQVMMAMSHKPVATMVRHPFQYILMMTKERQFADIMGRNLSDADLPGRLGVAQRNFRKAVSEELTSYHRDPMVPYRKMQRLGTWSPRTRGLDSVDDVVRGHADELGKLNADWAARMLATEVPGGGGRTYDPKMLIQIIRRGDNKEALEWYEGVANYYRSYDPATGAYKPGRRTWNPKTQKMGSANIDLADDLSLEKVLRETEDRLHRATGKNDELIHVVSQGRLKKTRTVELDNIKSTASDGLVVVEEGGERYVARYIGNNPAGVDVQPFAFVEQEATTAFTRLLSSPRIYDDPYMPKTVSGEIIDAKTPAAEAMKATFDRLLDRFFGTIYQQNTAKLERNPLFRQLYSQQLEMLAPSLDMPSVKAIISDISKRADDERRRAEDYLGETVWQKLLDIESGKIKSYGTITREELNAYASGVVLDEMKDMLYNAAERRNLTDGMRILSPFLQQQVEFLGRLGRTAFSPIQGGEFGYVPNLNVMRKTQLAVSGTTEADPDGDGRGFFYTDPTTGAWTFTIPLSGQLTKLLTGVEAPLNAPVKGLALGLDYRPGLGPFATIAASKILPDIPSTDMLRSFLLPYGERQGASEALLPSWFRKVVDGVTGYEGSGVYANTYVETMQALAATGEYNTSDPNDRDRLFEDARNKAQILTGLRGLQQFLGPAAGSFDYVVKSGEVDIYASQLSKALRELQEQDYDTAVINFVDIFGEEAFAYLGNKTRSVLGGLEATDVFNDFERTNEQLFRQYPDVAGFFAPSGTDFNFAVYQRQLSTGARKKLTAEEVLEEAEKNIAFAYYKAVRREFPVNTNDDEQEYLRTYRQKLEARFPGYAKQVFDPQKLPRGIDQLTMAAQRSDLDKNPVALAVRYYSEVRLRALEEANARGLAGFSAQSASDLREYLHNYGLALSQRYPEFARVYDRLLSREVEK